MDIETTNQLVEATRLLLEDESAEWESVEALWRPYVDQGDVDAKFHLADFYLDYGFDEGPQKDRGMRELLLDAADQGHPDAIYRLCNQYSEGPERDEQLLKAGKLGSLEAQRDLGALFASGDWTGPRDSVLATEWYRRAAVRGHADAQYNLGFMYFLGEGVQSDPQEGLRWLLLSAGQRNEHSFRLLADLYRNGYYGVPVDAVEAERWDEEYRKTNSRRLK